MCLDTEWQANKTHQSADTVSDCIPRPMRVNGTSEPVMAAKWTSVALA